MGQVDRVPAETMVACKNEGCSGGGITDIILFARGGRLLGARFSCTSCGQQHATPTAEMDNKSVRKHSVQCQCGSAEFAACWSKIQGLSFHSLGGTCQQCGQRATVSTNDLSLAQFMATAVLPISTTDLAPESIHLYNA